MYKIDKILIGTHNKGKFREISDLLPEKIHKIAKFRLKIPMKNNKRSLNIASSVAIILAESLKQTKLI